MNVVIVGKTHMQSQACIGGLVLENNRSVRLLQANGWNHPGNTAFEIGQLWDIDFRDREGVEPPHVEDVLIQHHRFVKYQDNLRDFLLQCIPVWRGSIRRIYDGSVRFTANGSGYVARGPVLPPMSTGYWLADQPLECEEDNGKVRYRHGLQHVTYVGFAPPIDVIPAGTLVRLSLARWWRPADKPEMEDRCYLQLSGWFL